MVEVLCAERAWLSASASWSHHAAIVCGAAEARRVPLAQAADADLQQVLEPGLALVAYRMLTYQT